MDLGVGLLVGDVAQSFLLAELTGTLDRLRRKVHPQGAPLMAAPAAARAASRVDWPAPQPMSSTRSPGRTRAAARNRSLCGRTSSSSRAAWMIRCSPAACLALTHSFGLDIDHHHASKLGRRDVRHRASHTTAAGYAAPVSGLEDFARLVDGDHGLCVVSTLRPDGTIQSSVVNAGVLPHPVTGAQVVGLVSRGDAARLANLRARPRATVVIRAGWQWAAVEGPVELAGPDDPLPEVDAERLRLLLREIFTAAGGTHDDFDTYDRVMAEERRVAVLVTPARISPAPRA